MQCTGTFPLPPLLWYAVNQLLYYNMQCGEMRNKFLYKLVIVETLWKRAATLDTLLQIFAKEMGRYKVNPQCHIQATLLLSRAWPKCRVRAVERDWQKSEMRKQYFSVELQLFVRIPLILLSLLHRGEAACCEYGSNKGRQKLISTHWANLSFLQPVNMPNQFEETSASTEDIIIGNCLSAEELRGWRAVHDFCFLCMWQGRTGRLTGAFSLKPPQFGWGRLHVASVGGFTLSQSQWKQINLPRVATNRY